MAERTDFFKEYLEDNFDDTKFTTIPESKEEYKYIKTIIGSLGMSPSVSDAAEKGETDSLDLGKVYLAEYDFEGTTKSHYVIVLFGGLNGCGKWKNYFQTLINVFDKLDEKCEDCWLIELDNDCADDVYTAYVGLKLNSESLKESESYKNRTQQFLNDFVDQLAAKLNEEPITDKFPGNSK